MRNEESMMVKIKGKPEKINIQSKTEVLISSTAISCNDFICSFNLSSVSAETPSCSKSEIWLHRSHVEVPNSLCSSRICFFNACKYLSPMSSSIEAHLSQLNRVSHF